MARKKSALVPIAKASKRFSTYRKRRDSLIKKTEELSILCGVDACILIYGPDQSQVEPDMWPPREKALPILSSFSNLSEAQRSKNMLDQKDVLSKQVEKLRVELRKVDEENARLEGMILLHDVLSGQCSLSDVASAGGMSALSGAVEARHKEVLERMHEMVTVAQPVGPLEEVLLQGQCSFGVAGANVVPQQQEQYFAGFDCDDMAPPGKKQCVFGVGNADVAPCLGGQLCLPNGYPVVGAREKGYGPESADVAPQGKEQFVFGRTKPDMAPPGKMQSVFGLGNADMAPTGMNQCVFGLGNADMAPPGKEQCLFGLGNAQVAPGGKEQCVFVMGSADMAPQGKMQCVVGMDNDDMAGCLELEGQLSLSNGYPVLCSSESVGEYGVEIDDVADVAWDPEAEEEIRRFFDWSSSALEDFLTSAI